MYHHSPFNMKKQETLVTDGHKLSRTIVHDDTEN